MNQKRILCLLALFLLTVSNLSAQKYTFRNYSTPEGLSHTMINCMIQDRLGFIWVGTSDGLNRFDGYSFKKYYSNKQDSLSLKNNNITALVEDGNGIIWVSTGNGFYCFSPLDESFQKVMFSGTEFNKLGEDLCVDDMNMVWGVDNSNVLMKFDANSIQNGEFIKLDSIINYKGRLHNSKLVYADGFIWVFSSAGIIRFDSKTMQAKIVSTEVKFESPRIIRKGKPGELYVVDWNMGVYLLQTDDLTLRPYLKEQILATTQNNMGITDINFKDSCAWVLSYPGLSKISQSGEIETFNTSSGYTRDYDKKIFFSSLVDKDGSLWLGTQDEGLIVVHESDNIFNHYSVNKGGMKKLPATKFIVDGDDILLSNLYGTFYGTKNQVSKVDGFQNIKKELNVAIAKYNEDEYLLFGKTKVIAFNKHTFQKRTIYETFNIQNGFVDSRGVIWMTHWGDGMEGYDPKTEEHFQIDVAKDDKSINVVFCIHEDTDGSLWLGTFGAGLQHVQNPTAKQPLITKYVHKKNENSISNNFITSLYGAEKGVLWVGTNGGGLNRFNKTDGSFHSYTTNDGLRGNVIQSIVSDVYGNIWFASNALTKFDIDKQTFIHYDKSNGVKSKYFSLNAQNTSDGYLYFGDDQGILYFNPNSIRDKGIPPLPVFTGVRLSGQRVQTRELYNGIVPFPHSVTYSDTITLPYYLNSFSFEFASLQIANSENISYSYKLDGFDQQWIQSSSSERLASYAGLPHGTHTLMVKASNEQNTYSQTRTISIIITPPWWKTVWFNIIVALLFLGVILLYILNLKRRNDKLERVVRKRTFELRKANENLEGERLVVEMKNKHLNDVLESKEKLINIVVHDFKNPLSGILGATELLEKESNNHKIEKIKKYSKVINSSASSLVNQMVSVLDWAQHEDENLQAHPIEMNIEVLVNDAINLVISAANQKDISIETQNNSLTNALIDPRMGSIIFRNILSNAIKFTPQKGSIFIIINESEKTIDISFIDNGIGIKEEVVSELMSGDSFIKSSLGTDNEIGTGMGLRMIKSFLEKNKGTLSVTSAERQGSVFLVSIPKGEKEIVRASSDEKKTPLLKKDTGYHGKHNKHTVLVVDDSKENIETIQATLEADFEVIHANNGQDGLNIVYQILPDIIISDINMPGMSGIELCGHVKKNKQTFHIPIILISSYKKKEVKDEAFNAGANDYIEKPFNTFHLLKKVESMLLLKQKIHEKAKNEIATEVFPDVSNSPENELLRKISQYVEDNLGSEKLNTNLVAEELNISRVQLWRILKKETGSTLGDFIKEKKLQKASAMLLSGKYRISEVGYEVGFKDTSYFSKWFTKERGMNPTQFIEKMSQSK